MPLYIVGMEHTNNDNTFTGRIAEVAADIRAEIEADVRHNMRLAAHAVGADAEIAHMRATASLDQLVAALTDEVAIMRHVNTRLAQRLAEAERLAAPGIVREFVQGRRGSGVADFDAAPPAPPAPFTMDAVHGFDGRVA